MELNGGPLREQSQLLPVLLDLELMLVDLILLPQVEDLSINLLILMEKLLHIIDFIYELPLIQIQHSLYIIP